MFHDAPHQEALGDPETPTTLDDRELDLVVGGRTTRDTHNRANGDDNDDDTSPPDCLIWEIDIAV